MRAGHNLRRQWRWKQHQAVCVTQWCAETGHHGGISECITLQGVEVDSEQGNTTDTENHRYNKIPPTWL